MPLVSFPLTVAMFTPDPERGKEVYNLDREQALTTYREAVAAAPGSSASQP